MQALQSVRNVRPKSQPITRYTGRTKRQDEISPAATSTDGFINHSFMPLCKAGKKLPEQDKTEQEFLRSATNLCKLHHLHIPDYSGYAYPYNILLIHRDIKSKLSRSPYETNLQIGNSGKDKAVTLSTEQVFEVGNDLFYIPVIPLYRYLGKKENKASGELLLAVMSYLYREAGVPYYRDDDGFMFCEYDMNKEYFLEARMENPDEYEEDISDILRNDICGDIMQRKLFNAYHLLHFEENIDRFEPQNPMQEECLLVAQEALNVFRDFPNCSVFQNIHPPGEDEDEEYATPETYIAFVGDYKGWVFESIERSVNDYLGNYSQMVLPTRVQEFDGTEREIENLEFEYRLFELIENLCNILYEMP